MADNYINHINFALDASSSMDHLQETLIKVVDEQIEHLAKRSDELNQETRVSIYTFNSSVQCVVYDMDVLRLPSIESLYRPNGMTALIDATLKSIDDLSQTATLYGDHAFLTYVLTDGIENASLNRPSRLKSAISGLADNWTVACLVPDKRGQGYAANNGFQKDNIAIWDATSAAGVIEVGKTIRAATETFMVNRSSGIRGTRSLFSTGIDAVNANTVKANLTPLKSNQYFIVPVHQDSPIKPYVMSRGFNYVHGRNFYLLTKLEEIQPQKQVVIRERKTSKVYAGPAARDLLGLPNKLVKVKPDFNPEYDVFVQSTAINRKVLANTDMLILN